MNTIEIWEPRYKDNVVLVSTRKVKADNVIVFTKAKHLEGKRYYLDGHKARKYSKQQIGVGLCYQVPFEVLTEIEEL